MGSARRETDQRDGGGSTRIFKWLRFRELRFSSITLTLFIAIFFGPLFESFGNAETLFSIVITFVMINAVYTMSDHPRIVWVALSLVLIGSLARWGVLGEPGSSFSSIGFVADELVLVLTTVLILKSVLRARQVTGEVIYGSIGAYLLIGFAWALLYAWVFRHDPGAFSGIDGTRDPLGKWTYHSFVTLTTLGYGDITPETRLAQSLSSGEAVVGQLFLAVLVARLVGLHVAQQQGSDSE